METGLSSEGTYPPELWRLLSDMRREINAQFRGVEVRLTYAPFQNIDAYIEVTVSGGADLPPRLSQIMEPTFRTAASRGYTVAVLLQ